MENTTEKKERFFHQYWGQVVVVYTAPDGKLKLIKNDSQYVYYSSIYGHFDSDYLLLTSLSNITDEHAIEIGKVLFDWGFMSHGTKLDIGKQFIKGHMDKLHTIPAKMVDFLRKYGYALPYDGKSVEEQIKLGWVKVRES